MSTELDTQQLNAFVDGELDLKSQLQMEAQLRTDPAASAQVESLRLLSQTVRAGAAYHAAPAALRERLAARAPAHAHVLSPAPQATAPAHAAAPASRAAAALQRWLGWRPMVVSFGLAACMALAFTVLAPRWAQDTRLLNGVVASHVRSTVGQHLVDVASSDHHTVKPWLSSKLGFSPPVGELQIPGAVFLGGRVDYLDERPVAALVYRQGEHVVNVFVWPVSASESATDSAADSTAKFTTVRGFQVAHWSRGGMNHWLISDLGRDEFTAVARALAHTGEGR